VGRLCPFSVYYDDDMPSFAQQSAGGGVYSQTYTISWPLCTNPVDDAIPCVKFVLTGVHSSWDVVQTCYVEWTRVEPSPQHNGTFIRVVERTDEHVFYSDANQDQIGSDRFRINIPSDWSAAAATLLATDTANTLVAASNLGYNVLANPAVQPEEAAVTENPSYVIAWPLEITQDQTTVTSITFVMEGVNNSPQIMQTCYLVWCINGHTHRTQSRVYFSDPPTPIAYLDVSSETMSMCSDKSFNNVLLH